MPAQAPVMAGARWVEPVLVARVKYRTWTAGHLLRHPVYQEQTQRPHRGHL